MNKTKKIAVAAVTLVMAGSMAVSLTACGNAGSGNGGGNAVAGGSWNTAPSAGAVAFATLLKDEYGLADRISSNAAGWTRASQYWDWLKGEEGEVSAEGANLQYTDNTQIGIAIGHNSAQTAAFYDTITGSVPLPGGYSAATDKIKPAFQAISDALDVSFVDGGYTGKSTSANLGDLKTSNKWGTSVDVCTTDLSVAVSSANNAGDILNLGEYLDQMPNFKSFLEANPIVYLSLLQSGMSQDGTGRKIYVAPYFDGNDDIERYCLIRQDWVEDLLDKTLSSDGATFSSACAATTSAGGYMGTSGTYSVETTVEGSTSGAKFTLTKDYDAAKAAAADTSTELGAAYNAIAGKAYAGESGNIVDIMNAALAENADATGKQLATLYRAYIDVAYKNGDAKAYTKRSDLFNGYSAAWDVDDLVAMLRIVKTNATNLGLAANTVITGIFPRDNTNDRTPDIVRLACQLYGERGADSRYEYTYINANNQLQDARANATFYQALENFALLAKEGLVAEYVQPNGTVGNVSGSDLKGNCKDKAGTGFMMYDYSQTQTTQMFDLSASDDYLFAPVSTPVSRWDDNSDGVKDTIMRFTESWRSTKTSGLAVAASVANNTNKLNAVLTFIDYLYSNDGQILSTFGIQSTNGNVNPNGTWYGTKVTNVDINTVAEKIGGQYVVKDEYKSQYFTFNNELYTGTLYKGEMTPTITTEMYQSFVASDGVNATFSARGNFTNYARKVLGTTLPMGVKDQSFENQCTAEEAAAEATKVSVSLANGTIKHPSLIPGENPWYTVVPTGLPLNSVEQGVIDAAAQQSLKGMTGTKLTDSKNFYSIFHWIIFKGYTGTYSQQGVEITLG